MHKPAATLCTAAKTCGLHKTTDPKKKKKNTQHFLMVFTEVAELLKPLTMTYPNPFNKIKLLKSKIQRAVIYSQCETHEFCNI